ncbi:MAG: FadR family transcriptional regulator [Ardenticatenaceae bacterium]|nr:FadR family transcriptional regulator [Ardenticatenaceae bacterium]HBY97725.1 hypothetical protein [Chloroflexota bacterium]
MVSSQPDSGDTVLQPIRARRLSEIAVSQITALIEDGRLTIGSQLPSERELMGQLGISRASVREALRVLESQGLIAVQPGKGGFVIGTVPQADILPGLLNWFEEHRDEVLDVIEVREMLESHAAARAAERATPEAIAGLREAVARMRFYVERDDLVEATNTDREFHRRLYEASGNIFLKLLGDGIVATLFGPRHSLLRIPGRAERSLRDHEVIVEAIAAGNPQAAREAIYRHMSRARDALASMRGGDSASSQEAGGHCPDKER